MSKSCVIGTFIYEIPLIMRKTTKRPLENEGRIVCDLKNHRCTGVFTTPSKQSYFDFDLGVVCLFDKLK